MTAVTGGAITLTAAAVLLAVLSAATARRPVGPVPAVEGYLDLWSALHGGYDPRGSFWARHWLRLAYVTARPLARRGVLPDVLTLWGLLVSAAVLELAAAAGRWPLLATAVLVASGLADSLDGCVALLTGRDTRFGFVLDSLADRASDALYLLALAALGAPTWLAVAAGAALVALEYTRARAGNAGMGEIGVVTVGERATRIVVTALALLFAGLCLPHRALAAALGAAATLALSTVGLAQLLVVTRRTLA